MARSPETTRNLSDRLARQVRRTAKTPDAAEVHNLRVVIRRFTQALALVSPHARGVKGTRRKLKKALKTTMTLAGDVRDVDVAIKLIDKLKPGGSEALRARLGRRRGQAERLLLDSLHAGIAAPIPQLKIDARSADQSAANEVMLRAAERLFKRGARAGNPKSLHRLRIAAKKLRYTLEFLAPRARGLAQIERLQSLLGDINDYETACRIVERESGGRMLVDQLQEKQRKKIRQFHRYWRSNFDGAANIASWMEELLTSATI